MTIVFFAHPHFLGQQSMPRFAQMLARGMKERGHKVEIWMPKPVFNNLPVPTVLKKWMGYIDQYVLFAIEIKKRLHACAPDTLFVFTDQALGPWVPMVADRYHVIHCHDFLAQRSALGEIKENPTRWTGRCYQRFIRSGYSRGRNFISVSNKTQEDLHRFLHFTPSVSEVVYNGLNQSFLPLGTDSARSLLKEEIAWEIKEGYILHVGGNEWYKNRVGVIEIYNAWRSGGRGNVPLMLIGNAPDRNILDAYNLSPYKSEIYFLSGRNDEFVRLAYCGASVLLFPSLEEGFGWPIAEAMASGCPVITTGEAPMTEVAGSAGFFIPRRPQGSDEIINWAEHAARVLDDVLKLSPSELKKVREAGLENASRFETDKALNYIMDIYKNILLSENKKSLGLMQLN